ncbi:hypothetical protein AK37_13644 [Rhodococcus pyridinivorans AK37]|uniref:Uncharacterized protein n=1 Tax=Rhodococcus pyridinivorans AK37 TaxID=1114960 RepID=H0JSR8_9NOCA|nr:hypothetical protein AK37_13644 [Rhodococcus pyridinivorans AK37]
MRASSRSSDVSAMRASCTWEARSTAPAVGTGSVRPPDVRPTSTLAASATAPVPSAPANSAAPGPPPTASTATAGTTFATPAADRTTLSAANLPRPCSRPCSAARRTSSGAVTSDPNAPPTLVSSAHATTGTRSIATTMASTAQR